MRGFTLAQFSTGLMSVVFVAVAASSNVYASPVGDKAHYDLDRNSSRTTSMILSGKVDVSVDAYIPGHKDGAAYESSMTYDFNVQMVGRKSGTQKVNVPADYFSPEFMANLRANGSYIGPDFKIQHEGFVDARTMDGNLYPHCDKILIYDMKTYGTDSQLGGLFTIAQDLIAMAAQSQLGTRADVEDLRVRAAIFAGVPVLGAVKLDVSGIVSGFNFKAGGDFKAGTDE